MPYGHLHSSNRQGKAPVSIPHMGCMPYGRRSARRTVRMSPRFNPSYGLHALRAPSARRWRACWSGFNPSYGLHALRAENGPGPTRTQERFQSLIWVACPTGTASKLNSMRAQMFQSLIWVACPTGSVVCRAKVQDALVSIPHMGCMPYGRSTASRPDPPQCSFNPSYGLHALRAASGWRLRSTTTVSIPHMGCMPYGLVQVQPKWSRSGFQSLIWVACPTGLRVRHGVSPCSKFQSLIWVACPTGPAPAGG